MEGMIKIGQLASAAGVTHDTVRYYERLRLLPRASRTRSGYRMYTTTDVERLRFIKQAQAFGFTLDQIRDLLPGHGAGLDECRKVRDLLRNKIEDLDQKLAELRAFRKTLSQYFDECKRALEQTGTKTCPVLFELAHLSRGRDDSARVTSHRDKKESLKQKRGVKK